jgi:hypothetical protein
MAWKSHWNKPIEKQDMIDDLETWIREVNHDPSFAFQHPERITYRDLAAIYGALCEKKLL